MEGVKVVAISRKERKERECIKTIINELEQKKKTKISETSIGASVTLRRVTRLELI
jgi:hypothetical protein